MFVVQQMLLKMIFFNFAVTALVCQFPDKDGNISTYFKFFISFPPKCRIFIMDDLKYEMLQCLVK